MDKYEPKKTDQLIIPELLDSKREMCGVLFTIRDKEDKYWLPPIRCGITAATCTGTHSLGS